MRNGMNRLFARMLRDKKRQKQIAAIVCALSVLVVAVVFGELMQPVITMTPEPVCGIEGHAHGEECYVLQPVCGIAEGGEHQHGEDCYAEVLSCGLSVHSHTPDCYPEQITEAPVLLGETNTAEETVQPEETQEPAVTEEPAQTQEPAGAEQPEETQQPAGELAVGVKSAQRSVFAGEAVLFSFAQQGGAQPVNVHISIVQGGETLYETDEFSASAGVTTHTQNGDATQITATITAVDANGVSATESLSVPCAVRAVETEAERAASAQVQLVEDWRANVAAVAKTQLGYRESEVNFKIGDDGEKRAYTRYGHWYGASYGEWCAMFASFCLEYAGVPENYFPQAANCAKWVAALEEAGLYLPAGENAPETGDLVFFDLGTDGKADHVGIVTEASASQIITIEGNVAGKVCERSYSIADAQNGILGYGSLTTAMERYLQDGGQNEVQVRAVSETDEGVAVTFRIANAEYTQDPGSGYTHVTVKSTQGLETGAGLTYEMMGTGAAYRVYGTGTLATYTVASGESLQDAGFAMPKISTTNQYDNGVDSNMYQYVSAYSWIDESGMVWNVNTPVTQNMTLTLRLYAADEKYGLDFVCCKDCRQSVSYALHYPGATFGVQESVSAQYIPTSADVNAGFRCSTCDHAGKVLDHWAILAQDGTEATFGEGEEILPKYLPTQGDTISVYAVWKDAPATVSVKFVDADFMTEIKPAEETTYGAKLADIKPTDPTREGCTFAGWTLDSGETLAADDMPVTTDATFIAVYNATITELFPDIAGGNIDTYAQRTLTVRTGRPLSEAVDANGASFTAAPAIQNGYFFEGWQVSGDSGLTTDLSAYSSVMQGLTVTAQYKRGCTLTLGYQNESGEYVIARTLYVKMNGTLGQAVNEDGVSAGLSAMLPQIHVAGYTFNYWTTEDGSRFVPSSMRTYNSDTVYTANLTRLMAVQLQEMDLTDTDGDGDSSEYITTHTLYVASGSALSSAVDAQGTPVAMLPTGTSANGRSFAGWTTQDGQTDATPDMIVTEDMILRAKYETALNVVFNYEGTQYSYTVTAGTTLDQVLALAQADEANPLPLDEIMQNRTIEVDGVPTEHSFAGWNYTAIGSDMQTESRPAPGSMQINENMTFVATYMARIGCELTLWDIDTDGSEPEYSFSLLARPGETAAQCLADTVMSDGANAAGLIWYTLGANGEKILLDKDAVLTGDMTLYTYSYRMVLDFSTATQTASAAGLLDVLFPSAQAEVNVTKDGSTITITMRESDKLSAADLVIDGTDYSMYTVQNADTGKSFVLGTLIGQSLTGNTTLQITSAPNNKKMVHFYVFVDGERKEVVSRQMEVYVSGGKICLTAGQLESVYSQYGVKAADIARGERSAFAQTNWDATQNKANDSIWLDTNTFTKDGVDEVVLVPTLPEGDTREIVVYYLPAEKGGNGFSGVKYDTKKTNNMFYSITVEDNQHKIYAEGEQLPEVQYVLTGNGATVTVPSSNATGVWAVKGSNNWSSTDNGDGTTTYTFEQVASPVTLFVERSENEFEFDYAINITTDEALQSARPTVEGGDTYQDTFVFQAGDAAASSYIVKTPSAVRYNIVGLKSDNQVSSWATVVFRGWIVNDDETTILQPGAVLTKEQVMQYADDDGALKLTAKWERLETTHYLSFFVNLALEVENANSEGGTPKSHYTEPLYGAELTIVEEPSNWPDANEIGKGIVLEATKSTTAETDAILRSIVDGITGTYAGAERTFTLGSFPDDEAILAKIRTTQTGYIASYLAWLEKNPNGNVDGYLNGNNKIIYDKNAGDYIPTEQLTSENYTVRWYVLKYQGNTAWHIDGVLVKKKGQLTVTKSFYGYGPAINDVKTGYSIDVNTREGTTLYQLNLQEKSETNANGYTDYDAATDTYTWVIDLEQNATYTLVENGYQAAKEYTVASGEGQSVTIDMATLAEYMVVNDSTAGDVPRAIYPEGGVQVTANAYEVDTEYSGYKTVRFINSYIPTNTMLLSKVDDSGQPLSGVVFQLKQRTGGEWQVHPVWKDTDGIYYIFDPNSNEGIVAEKIANGYITTDTLGYAMVIGLKDEKFTGDYSLTEVTPPEGYTGISAPVEFTVESDGGLTLDKSASAELVGDLTIRVRNTSETMDVTVNKVWTDGTNREVTVALCLDGTVLNGYTVRLNTANQWAHTWENVPAYVGGSLAQYTLRETWIGDSAYSASQDDGYENYIVTYDNPVYTYDANGRPTALTLTVRNRTYTGGLEFTKTDENNQPLAGATFALYRDENCTAQYGATQTSGPEGIVRFGSLAAGTYYMKETAAPAGYVCTGTVYKVVVSGGGTSITVNGDETNSRVTSVVNVPASADITIKKVDGNGESLSGAIFQIKRGGSAYLFDGRVSNITGSGAANGQTITVETSADSYTIAETTIPAGYYGMAGQITFKVTNGTVTDVQCPAGAAYDANTNTFTVTNTPGVELPSTGGAGTSLYTIGGLLVMAVSLLYGFGQRRRRERREAIH